MWKLKVGTTKEEKVVLTKEGNIKIQVLIIITKKENNLKNLDVKFPLGVLTVVTGVSGSGKSTLIRKVLFPALGRHLGTFTEDTGKFTELSGSLNRIEAVEMIDQNPIGKSSRSNPVTYIKAYDYIRQMMADGELVLALTFNPNEAANEIAAKRLPATVVSWQFEKGTIGNTHFVAIPYNARARAGAQVVANFLLSPAAQARKADIAHWGDPTVLDVARLPAPERALFGTGQLPGLVKNPAPTLPEPHASWVDPLEKAWAQRYGA